MCRAPPSAIAGAGAALSANTNTSASTNTSTSANTNTSATPVTTPTTYAQPQQRVAVRVPSPASASGNSRSAIGRALQSRVAMRTNANASASANGGGDGCESYVRLKKRSALTWSTRFAVLRGGELRLFYCKQDAALGRPAVDALALASGRLAPRADLALELRAADGRELQARVFSRADLARWVTALHRLALRREASASASASATQSAESESASESRAAQRHSEPGGGREASAAAAAFARASERSSALASEAHDDDDGDGDGDDCARECGDDECGDDAAPEQQRRKRRRRRVSFHGSVAVRLIPALEQAQVAELFYSRQEVERFSAQASSLRSRTEDAVSCAFLSLRRGPAALLPWRRAQFA